MLIEDDIPRYDFRGTAGDEIRRSFQRRDEDSGELDVWTGDELRMQFRENLSDATPVFDLSITNGGISLLDDDTVIEFHVSKSDVRDKISIVTDQKPGFPYIELYYDVESNPPNGETQTIMRGMYRFTAEVTKP